VSTAPTKAQLIRETRHGLVVRLRVEGLRYREISDRVGLSIAQCQRIFEAAMARRRGDVDAEAHRAELFADAQIMIENLRPAVLFEEYPRARDVDRFLDALEMSMRILGMYDAAPPAPVAQGSAKTRSSTNVHLEPKSMWSAVLERPRED